MKRPWALRHVDDAGRPVAPRHIRHRPKLINCECGYVACADSDETVGALIKAHRQTDHLEMLERVSDEDLRGWIQDECPMGGS